MPKPLDLYARLSISIDGNQLNARAADNLITIELPDLLVARALCKTWRSRRERERFLGKVMAMLADRDWQVEIRLSNRQVARLGVGVRPSLSAWLLGLNPLELHPMQILRAIANRNN